MAVEAGAIALPATAAAETDVSRMAVTAAKARDVSMQKIVDTCHPDKKMFRGDSRRKYYLCPIP